MHESTLFKLSRSEALNSLESPPKVVIEVSGLNPFIPDPGDILETDFGDLEVQDGKRFKFVEDPGPDNKETVITVILKEVYDEEMM